MEAVRYKMIKEKQNKLLSAIQEREVEKGNGGKNGSVIFDNKMEFLLYRLLNPLHNRQKFTLASFLNITKQ